MLVIKSKFIIHIFICHLYGLNSSPTLFMLYDCGFLTNFPLNIWINKDIFMFNHKT